MANVYVATAWLVDDDGERHEFGDKIEIPNTTDTEKASFQRLLDYGVISQSKPTKAEPEQTVPERKAAEQAAEQAANK